MEWIEWIEGLKSRYNWDNYSWFNEMNDPSFYDGFDSTLETRCHGPDAEERPKLPKHVALSILSEWLKYDEVIQARFILTDKGQEHLKSSQEFEASALLSTFREYLSYKYKSSHCRGYSSLHKYYRKILQGTFEGPYDSKLVTALSEEIYIR